MKERQHTDRPLFLLISNETIMKGLEGLSQEQLNELGITEGLLLMIRQGHAKQLRQDFYNKLSEGLGLDISADASSPQQSKTTQK